jgi:hypothetical protein
LAFNCIARRNGKERKIWFMEMEILKLDGMRPARAIDLDLQI